MRPSFVAIVGVLALIAACGGDDGSGAPDQGPPGDPVAAVTMLSSALAEGDFLTAAELSVPGQAVLMALAEGATVSQVVRSLDEGGAEVAANFWTGFAQGAGGVLTLPLEVVESGTVTEGGLEYRRVSITPEGGEPRTLYLRDVDGWKVDLFASFAGVLSSRLQAASEVLVNSGNEDAIRILSALGDIVPSLLVAAGDPAATPGESQNLLKLIEVITRVG